MYPSHMNIQYVRSWTTNIWGTFIYSINLYSLELPFWVQDLTYCMWLGYIYTVYAGV